MFHHLQDVIQGKTCLGVPRSSRWSEVKKGHLKRFPLCAACGGHTDLEVHHIKEKLNFRKKVKAKYQIFAQETDIKFGKKISFKQMLGEVAKPSSSKME